MALRRPSVRVRLGPPGRCAQNPAPRVARKASLALWDRWAMWPVASRIPNLLGSTPIHWRRAGRTAWPRQHRWWLRVRQSGGGGGSARNHAAPAPFTISGAVGNAECPLQCQAACVQDRLCHEIEKSVRALICCVQVAHLTRCGTPDCRIWKRARSTFDFPETAILHRTGFGLVKLQQEVGGLVDSPHVHVHPQVTDNWGGIGPVGEGRCCRTDSGIVILGPAGDNFGEQFA